MTNGLSHSYAPVICIPGPLGAGDTGDIAGLKCRNLTSDVSRQCRGCAGVKLVSVAEHTSLNFMGCKATKTGVLMKWPVCINIRIVLLFGVLNSNKLYLLAFFSYLNSFMVFI